jgi:hypothetical protein
VNEAMRRHVEHDERARALGDFISAWEALHGEITQEEMDAAARAARRSAIVVRGKVGGEPAKTTSGRAPRRQASRKSARPRARPEALGAKR